MKRILTLGLFLTGYFWLATLHAQVSVQATAVRLSAEKGEIIVKVTIDKGVKVFSVIPRDAEDPFVSSFENGTADSTPVAFGAAEETGALSIIDHDAAGAGARTYENEVSYSIPVSLIGEGPLVVKGVFNWLGIQGDNFPSGAEEFAVEMPAFSQGENAGTAPAGEQPKKGWALFLITFLVGFGAVFTPCVFPLMPVTVSFFLKKSKTRAEGVRNAWVYALFIILIYTIPTLLFTIAFGDKFLYQLSTHPVSNLLFFLIFLVFAISFFGAFDITLPSSWANKTDSAAQRGGYVGIFFMALTLVIVSFSCTGPIVGALLGETSGKGISMGPVIGMLGFGTGLAIPFGVLALFPSMMQSLPKSGGWLNTVKVFFGF
ncbi:MAG TPA: cytochrome c biogenesis protein CcdA, partial [Phnomibacter sp.]|nr:cytochrome c biogenesis protein CcdA [Phnomibacter sp.]